MKLENLQPLGRRLRRNRDVGGEWGNKESLAKRSRSFIAEIDEEQIGSYLGTAS